MQPLRFLTRPALCAIVVLWCVTAHAGDWPQFRGPTGQGISDDVGLPLEWSETEHIKWKTAIPGLGWSSPSVKGDRIWLTTGADEGKSLRAIVVDARSGRVLHDKEVFRLDNPGPIHHKNSHASPTPVVNGEHTFVHFGAHGTACLDAEANVVWKTKLEYEHDHGPGGSPTVFDDMLIISCDGAKEKFVVALDKRTGEVRWKTMREGRTTYSTPRVIEVEGVPRKFRTQLICNGGGGAVAYDPRTGEPIWRIEHEGYSLVPAPVYGRGLLFLCTGYDSAAVHAVRPTGQGNVTNTHIAWTLRRGAPHNPSPLLVDDMLFLVSDRGVASCVDAETGDIHWQRRLGGDYSASPVYAEGRVYILDENGVTHVIAAKKNFEKLAENTLEGRTLASIAISAPAIYIRTDSHLYRIEN